VKPDASTYDPRPEYLAELIGSTGLTQAALAGKIGVDERTIRRWLSGERQFNYRDQFAIECLVLSV
jgi:transcriptional regulator with XRE-family HTH domain